MLYSLQCIFLDSFSKDVIKTIIYTNRKPFWIQHLNECFKYNVFWERVESWEKRIQFLFQYLKIWIFNTFLLVATSVTIKTIKQAVLWKGTQWNKIMIFRNFIFYHSVCNCIFKKVKKKIKLKRMFFHWNSLKCKSFYTFRTEMKRKL